MAPITANMGTMPQTGMGTSVPSPTLPSVSVAAPLSTTPPSNPVSGLLGIPKAEAQSFSPPPNQTVFTADDVQKMRDGGLTDRAIANTIYLQSGTGSSFRSLVDGKTAEAQKNPDYFNNYFASDSLDAAFPSLALPDAASPLTKKLAPGMAAPTTLSSPDLYSRGHWFSDSENMLAAPGNLMTGALEKGLSYIPGLGSAANLPEAKGIHESTQQVMQNLPNYAMMISPELAPEMGLGTGVAGRMAATGIGTGIGQAAKEGIQDVHGTNTNTLGQQAGNVLKEGVLGGLTEGAAKLVSAGGSKMADYLSEQLPAKLTNSVLKPLAKEFNFGKNPGQAVVDEGLTAPTRQALLPAITSRKQEIGSALGDMIEKASKGPGAPQIDMAPSILGPIKEAMLSAKQNGEREYFNSLQDLKDGLTKTFGEAGGTIAPMGEKGLVQTPLGVWQQKQALGDAMRWTGAPFDKDLNQVKLQIFQNLKKQLTDAVPEAKPLMNRYAGMLGAENSLKRTINLAETHSMLSLPQKVGALAGAAAGFLTGGPIGAGIGAGLTAGGEKAITSTATKTISAKALSKFTPVVTNILSHLSVLAPTEKAMILKAISDHVLSSHNPSPHTGQISPLQESQPEQLQGIQQP